MKILFAGSPAIACPALRAIANEFDVVGVLTNEDKPGSRGRKLLPTPVKEEAIKLGIPVYQFSHLRTDARRELINAGAEMLVSFAYGKIFGPKFLALFSKGTVNVHPSLLPEFRGASPIQATVYNGKKYCGISIQEIALKMDEGRLYDQFSFPLTGLETEEGLTETVAVKVPELLVSVLKKIEKGTAELKPQSGQASYTEKIKKEDGKIDFSKTAVEVHAQIRSMYPWPKAYALYNGEKLFITSVWGGFEEIEKENITDTVTPGTVMSYNKKKGIAVSCSDKPIWITGFQIPSKKELDFRSFFNGNRGILNTVLE